MLLAKAEFNDPVENARELRHDKSFCTYSGCSYEVEIDLAGLRTDGKGHLCSTVNHYPDCSKERWEGAYGQV